MYTVIRDGGKLLICSIILCIEMLASGVACAGGGRHAAVAPSFISTDLMRRGLHDSPDVLNFPPLPKRVNETACDTIRSDITVFNQTGSKAALSVFVDNWNSSAVPHDLILEASISSDRSVVGTEIFSKSPDGDPDHAFVVERLALEPGDPAGTLRVALKLPVSPVYEGSRVWGVDMANGQEATSPYPSIVGKLLAPAHLTIERSDRCGPATVSWNGIQGQSYDVTSDCFKVQVHGNSTTLPLDPGSSHTVSVAPHSNCTDGRAGSVITTLQATLTGDCTPSQSEGFVSCPLTLEPVEGFGQGYSPSAVSVVAGLGSTGVAAIVAVAFVGCAAAVAGTYCLIREGYKKLKGSDSKVPDKGLEAGEPSLAIPLRRTLRWEQKHAGENAPFISS